MSNINLTKHLSSQGTDKNTKYPAIVVNNNDPDMLGRVQARIETIHDGIDNKLLPWCLPTYAHVDGALGGNVFNRSGTFFVPKNGTRINVTFQDGDPHFPLYEGAEVNDLTKLKEVSKNYPNRSILRFSNGSFIMIDTSTNELFIHNAGDLNLIVQGNLNQQVFGNSQEIVTESKSGLDPYFTDDKLLPIGAAKQSQTNNVKFKGLGKTGGSGNKNILIDGDYTMTVKGNRITKIMGDDTTTILGNSTIKVMGSSNTTILGSMITKVTGSISTTCSSVMTYFASLIKLN